ncbi:hypothetical protein WR25_23302 isoform G [Diploscapter pachys]|uniref:Uncharacterized protein n=1 Tax=Diploscapter pachys TaxID=2018661 RepID=A0A2A2J7D5_9BILA|nr:hypothetical protein WR25_23302 isoform A [Diploscapter pachys]PAV57674.1 hypothetical protein WR25_23302 isoform E [Diploscapter pachys]PAV57675.1 hypothetical protein WR25_23302 isoform F [Diploscapter pachys]PAV57676.1 hypothetical protein WR25_23302 isoform G [Diploscapter pachys]
MYLDRFCYQSESGVLEYHIEYPADRPREMLLLYYDTEDQWPRAYKELQTCEERVELLRNISENNQIIYLDPYSTSESNGDSKCKLYYQTDNEEWISCTGFRTFRAARSRWWFLALASCSDTDDALMSSSNASQYWGIYAEYKLTMTNGQPSDIFHYQFSDDEWPILPADIAFLVTNFILLAISYVVGFQLSSRRLYHSIYRIYVQSVAFETGGLILCVLHGLIYSTDGIGMSFLRQMGQLLRGIAQMMFVFMCLLLSRGLNVTRMKLGKADNCFIILMVIVFVTSYFGMLLWEIRGFDPATVYYPGESVPGYLLAVWRIVAWIFFLAASLHSAKIYPNKKAFFRNFAILLTPWYE